MRKNGEKAYGQALVLYGQQVFKVLIINKGVETKNRA